MNKLLLKLLARAYRKPDEDNGSENGGGEVVGTRNADRLAMLESIADNADRGREGDLADVNDDDTTSPFKAPTAEDAAAEEQAEAEEQVAALEEIPVNEAPARIVRKVLGKDIEITDELLTRAQKLAAADVYLAEAKRTRDELAAQLAGSKKEPEESQAEKDLALVRAIQMGTEEEALAAFRQFTSKGPSTDDLYRTIDARMDQKSAMAKFQADFDDVVSDPVLTGWANDLDKKLLSQGDNRPYGERYTEIGNTIRTWMASKAPAVAAPQEAKQQRKAAAPAAVKSTGGKAQSPNEEEPEESYSDVVSKMAAARGGPQWMNGRARS